MVISGVLTTAESLGRVSLAASALSILGWGVAYAVMLFANLLVSVRWIRVGPARRPTGMLVVRSGVASGCRR